MLAIVSLVLMPDKLSTSLIISAQIRIAAQQGIPITIVQKGNDYSGAILLKINRLDGSAEILNQVHSESGTAWMPASPEPMTELEADRAMMQQISFDPDLWALEIEDKEGRHWFDGDILDI